MKNGVKVLIGFFTGGLVGGFISYQSLKRKFEKRLAVEIESIKNAFSNKDAKNKQLEKPVNAPEIEQSVGEYTITGFDSSEEKDYTDYTKFYKTSAGESAPSTSAKVVVPEEKKEPKKKTSKTRKGPYIISPSEFDTNEDYETIYLTYYADGVLADERDNRVDIKTTIGSTTINKFGEYEEDVIYVRNDEKKCDYEVSRDNRTFKELIGDDEDEEG